MGNKARAQREHADIRTRCMVGVAGHSVEPEAAELSQYDARENPGKITHGFWLQQYSWLHNEHGTPDCRASPQLGASTAANRRGRFLLRWTNLVRSFGGSTTDTPQATFAGRKPETDNLKADKRKSSDVLNKPMDSPMKERKRRGWLKSLSSSTSSWLAPLAHQSRASPSSATPSQSPQAPASPNIVIATADHNKSLKRQTTESPYRQLARVLQFKAARDNNSPSKRSGLRVGATSAIENPNKQLISIRINESSAQSRSVSADHDFQLKTTGLLLNLEEAPSDDLFRRCADTKPLLKFEAETKSKEIRWNELDLQSECKVKGAECEEPIEQQVKVGRLTSGSCFNQEQVEPSSACKEDENDKKCRQSSSSEFRFEVEKRVDEYYANEQMKRDELLFVEKCDEDAMRIGRVSVLNGLSRVECDYDDSGRFITDQSAHSACNNFSSTGRQFENSNQDNENISPRQHTSKTQVEAVCKMQRTRVTRFEESLVEEERSLMPLIQPLASSSSSLGSICLEGNSMHERSDLQLSPSAFAAVAAVSSVPAAALAIDTPSRLEQPAAQSSERPVSQPTAPSSVGLLRDNFKRLVKRQQSVDSYRMARDLKKKQRLQLEAAASRQQSNKMNESSDSNRRKYSMRVTDPDHTSGVRLIGKLKATKSNPSESLVKQALDMPLRICIDPYAKPGSFVLPGSEEEAPEEQSNRKVNKRPIAVSPTPPNTLSLLPAAQFSASSFSGSITPTYPTHHLPSPKYVAAVGSEAKKYSSGSTASSSLTNNKHHAHSDTDGSVTPSPLNRGGSNGRASGARLELQSVSSELGSGTNNRSSMGSGLSIDQVSIATATAPAAAEEALAAAARRANLAEHIYDNKCGLGEDMKFLASLPELCDITFLVGETREPVCAVKSVLAARSRVFYKILFGSRQPTRNGRLPTPQAPPTATSPMGGHDRRSSSPRAALQHRPLTINKSSSPTPSGQPNWSVTADASGYNPPLVDSGAGDLSSAGSRSGRSSVARSTRDSVSRASQGSQQPLIIGPGQTAAPAKRSKKSSIRDNRLSRMFMRRASDPSIKSLNHPANHANHSNQNYLDRMSSSQMSTTMIIEEFEPDVFRQLIEYIHTGCVLLQARTLLGLLNAADYYGLEQLRKACLRFVSCCITADTVCSLLSTAERYIQYKCTKSIVQKVLEFVDTHADEIFKLNAFGLLPEHVVRLILARDGLKADEQVKYNGVYTWCEHYCRSYELTNIADVMSNFLDLIQFHKIPTQILLSEIYPARIVPHEIFLSALAYQANPENFEPQPLRARRMTLPNPTIHKDQEQVSDSNEFCSSQLDGTALSANINSSANNMEDEQGDITSKKELHKKRKQAFGSQQVLEDGNVDGQQATSISVHSKARARKSIGGAAQVEAIGGSSAGKLNRLRKGSLAQVSISNVMRLSHKLSIKKRHHANQANALGQSTRARHNSNKRGSSIVSSTSSIGCSISRQQSIADRNLMQVGQQILDAYLSQEERKKEQLEEEERKKREVEQLSKVEQSNKQLKSEIEQQPIVKISSTRKSFKDFKHISRRIFMRHSSSKMLQKQQSSSSTNSTIQQQQQQQQQQQPKTGNEKDKSRRTLLKIKRSETVFETTCATTNPTITSSTTSGLSLHHQPQTATNK